MMDTIELNITPGTSYAVPKEKCRVVGMMVVPKSSLASTAGNININAPSNSDNTILQAAMSSTAAGSVVKGTNPSSIANATKYQTFGPDTPIPVSATSISASTVVNLQVTIDPFCVGPHVFPSSG